MQADYDRETAQMKADYEAKKAAVDKYADKYDDNPPPGNRQAQHPLHHRHRPAHQPPGTTA